MTRVRFAAFVILLLALSAGAAMAQPPVPQDPAQSQIRELEQQIEQLRARAADGAKAAPTVSEAARASATLSALEARIEELERELAKLRDQLHTSEQEKAEERARIDSLEKKAALDRLNLSGEIRIASDTLLGRQAAHFDGLRLQKGIVDSMFYMQTNGGGFPFPSSPGDPRSIYATLDKNVAAHYADYLLFTSRLSFKDLKGALATFPAPQQQALMQMLLPGTNVAEQDYRNDILYTTRLRLNLRTEITEHMSFSGRLAMYKAWGDSAGVQVFNGAPTSINVDGTTVGVPNSDIVRVDRAYFDWNRIGGSGLYFSLGRRPSSGGPPTEIREGRLRGGTPLGHVVDYQFDGVTVGYAFKESMPGAVWRFCYGLGYESGFGSGDQLRAPADRLQDVHFGGFNLDLYSSDHVFVQATALRAWNVTDGFNSLVVMPADPVTGNPAPGPAVMRFTPSSNLGDIDLAAIALQGTSDRLKWFGSVAGMRTNPENVTTPFGGLLSDPFSVPESQTAWSVYTGLRFDLPNGTTQIGGEYNRGSQYWFNFTHNADEILLSKLATRGNVFEAYVNQGLGRFGQLRISGINYDYDYSGSGWHMGAPKSLDEMSVLGFPTYKNVFNLRVALSVRF